MFRYLRHIDLPQIGFAGQENIARGSVLLVGLGGLGSAAALYLAGAGIGRIGLADDDRVEEANLQRQILYSESDVERLKTEAALERLQALNSKIILALHKARIMPKNAAEILDAYDVVLDCSDNFSTRFLLNETCRDLGKVLVTASVQGMVGQIAVFDAREENTACYRCLFPETPREGTVPTCPEAGVFGPVAGIFGTLQAAEALKLLAGEKNKSKGAALFQLDTETLISQRIHIPKNPGCPVCAGKTTHEKIRKIA